MDASQIEYVKYIGPISPTQPMDAAMAEEVIPKIEHLPPRTGQTPPRKFQRQEDEVLHEGEWDGTSSGPWRAPVVTICDDSPTLPTDPKAMTASA